MIDATHQRFTRLEDPAKDFPLLMETAPMAIPCESGV